MEEMKLEVGCYSGRKADETPVRFRLEDCQYMVEDVLDQRGTAHRTPFTKYARTMAISIPSVSSSSFLKPAFITLSKSCDREPVHSPPGLSAALLLQYRHSGFPKLSLLALCSNSPLHYKPPIDHWRSHPQVLTSDAKFTHLGVQSGTFHTETSSSSVRTSDDSARPS